MDVLFDVIFSYPMQLILSTNKFISLMGYGVVILVVSLLVFLGGVIALLAIGASQDNVRASVLSCHCEHLFSECLYLMFPRRGCALAAGA